MNDFTKEELDDLRIGIDSLRVLTYKRHKSTTRNKKKSLIAVGSFDSTWDADIKALKIKLQFLIDNYCEHESDGEDYRYHCAHHYKCIKCGEFYR